MHSHLFSALLSSPAGRWVGGEGGRGAWRVTCIISGCFVYGEYASLQECAWGSKVFTESFSETGAGSRSPTEDHCSEFAW